MKYNEGAEIVPLPVLNLILVVEAPGAELPDDYSRVQLLTESAIQNLVLENHDRGYIIYGEDSPDFPLCKDFATMCHADILRGSIKSGLAVRPAFGTLEYTKTPPHGRHAINFAVSAGRKVLYYEPQTDEWLDAPKDLKSLDRFRL